ncbi:hypothetical protein HYU22_02575 [Candidatus Woesearchaeota archaeon]|nr:hypothetical protein [Candidatus Woesearchaeota archaeon]
MELQEKMTTELFKYLGLAYANITDLESLLQQQKAVGPFAVQRIIREGVFFTSGITRCYREATRIAREEEYDFAVAKSMEIGKKGFLDVEFYRFTSSATII